MKNKKIKIPVVMAALAGALFCSPNTFAENSYNINYTGGEPLGANNVKIEPDYVNSLTPLLQAGVVETTPDQSNYWEEGYIKDWGACMPIYYYRISNNPKLMMGNASNRHVTFSNDQFRAELTILNETLDGADFEYDIPIGVMPNNSYIYANWQPYYDSSCEQPVEGIIPLSRSKNAKIFIEMEVSLYEQGSETPYTAKELFFGITDIDAGQSYKILNNDSLLKPSSMYAKSAAALQPQDPEVTLRNMYVSSGNYIYSQYNTESWIDIARDSDIYAKLGSETQKNSVHFVFGFVANAASGIEYYAVPFDVQYDADENGSITGINDEKVFPNQNPKGSSYAAKGKYVFSHWIADVDVTLENGTTIKAGDPITNEQIKQVVVNKDIKFTAIFEIEAPAVPNTGASTANTSAMQITLSVFGVLLGALLIRSLPRLAHKKVDFDK